MNGIQIHQLLSVVEARSERTRALVAADVKAYLKANMGKVVDDLGTTGQTEILTRRGSITLTAEDLEC